MIRRILSIIAGVLLGLLIIMVFRVIVVSFYPFPTDLEWMNQTDMNQYLHSLPDKAFVIIAASHVLGSFFGALIAALVANRGRFSSGIVAGAILFVFVTLFNFRFDFPTLFVVASTLVSALAGFAGAAFGQGRKVR